MKGIIGNWNRPIRLVSFFWALGIGLGFAQSVHVPIGHWAYEFLDRLESYGLLRLSNTLPLSRQEIAEAISKVDSVLKSRNPLSSVESKMLERLKGEFWEEYPEAKRIEEKEPHFFSWNGEKDRFFLDWVWGMESVWMDHGAPRKDRETYRPYFGAIFRGELGGIGYYSDNRIYTEWGSRDYVQNYRPGGGYPFNAELDSSRATWDESVSYLIFRYKGFRLQLGRDRVRWGPSDRNALGLSGDAHAMDLAALSTDAGRLRFSWLHGILRSDFDTRWLAAHRIEYRLSRRCRLGWYETVVYGRSFPEFVYLNPVFPFLIAEHTLGDRDNVAMGFDFDWIPVNRLRIFGELFIDDLYAPWDLFKDYWGNKLAFTTGGSWIDPFGLSNSAVRCEYTRIDPFVYTHHDSVNVYEHYDQGIGSQLQPNSDEIWVSAEVRPWFPFQCTFFFEKQRHAGGDRRTAHQDSDGTKKQFLSGVVETRVRVGMNWHIELMRDWFLTAEISGHYLKNTNRIQDVEDIYHTFYLALNANW